MAILTKNTNFKDEYLGPKIFPRHETWHGGSERSILTFDQKLAKSLKNFSRKVRKTPRKCIFFEIFG